MGYGIASKAYIGMVFGRRALTTCTGTFMDAANARAMGKAASEAGELSVAMRIGPVGATVGSKVFSISVAGRNVGMYVGMIDSEEKQVRKRAS
jgi:hypothetical protein